MKVKGIVIMMQFKTVALPATIYRKKGILEILLGWIPIIVFLFRSNKPDVITPEYYSLIFQKEI